jgi:hypothetical protein
MNFRLDLKLAVAVERFHKTKEVFFTAQFYVLYRPLALKAPIIDFKQCQLVREQCEIVLILLVIHPESSEALSFLMT